MWHILLFQLLCNRLYNQVLDTQGQPELRWIDFYNSQDLRIKDQTPSNLEHPIGFPNVLVEFNDLKYQNDIGNQLVQLASGTLRIYVGQDKYSDTYQLRPNYGNGAATQSDGLQRYLLLQRINNALHGLTGAPLAQPLYRTAEIVDIDHSNVIYDIIEYQLSVADCTAQQAAPPIATTQIQHLHINPDYDNVAPLTHIQTGEQDEAIANNQPPSINTPYIIQST